MSEWGKKDEERRWGEEGEEGSRGREGDVSVQVRCSSCDGWEVDDEQGWGGA